MKLVSLVILGVVNIDDKHLEGSFKAMYYDENGKSKTKESSIQAHGKDIAYEMVDLWAEDISKEFDVPYHKKTKRELISKITTVRGYKRRVKPSDGISTGENRSLLSNKLYLKTEINRVFDVIGYDKLKDILKLGNEHLDTLEVDRSDRIKNLGKAKENMAQSMYLTFIETKVDTSSYCNDGDIVKRFNELKAEAENQT